MVVAPVGRDEDDGKDEFDDDEGEFHPEGDAEDAVLAVVCLRGIRDCPKEQLIFFLLVVLT